MQLSDSEAPGPPQVRFAMFTPVTSPLPVRDIATVTVPASARPAATAPRCDGDSAQHRGYVTRYAARSTVASGAECGTDCSGTVRLLRRPARLGLRVPLLAIPRAGWFLLWGRCLRHVCLA